MEKPRVLVTTIPEAGGGVRSMTNVIIRLLMERQYEPVVAYYEYFSVAPELSVPFYKLPWKTVGAKKVIAYQGLDAYAIGAWLPELEFTNYWPHKHWRKLMEHFQYFVTVSGNNLAATPFAFTGKPFLCWAATEADGDRNDRISKFPFHRRLLDYCVNSWMIRRYEKRILRAGRVVSLSRSTARNFHRIDPQYDESLILPMPIDLELFKPSGVEPDSDLIGFVGRYTDPRKNIRLLINAMPIILEQRPSCRLVLIGSFPTPELTKYVQSLQLENRVEMLGPKNNQEVASILSSLTAFVVPSHQEGLCIAALEAMAAGCPVISTRCGGPEEFVIPGETGVLVESTGHALAAAVLDLLRNPEIRRKLSANARSLIERKYSYDRVREVFWDNFRQVFPSSN